MNPSENPTFQAILEAHLSRRDVLRGGLGAAAVPLRPAHHGPHADDVQRPGRRPPATANRRRSRGAHGGARSTTAPTAPRPGART
jgi:hypothetical protein